MEEHKRVLKEAFGSSSSEGEEEDEQTNSFLLLNWERVSEINGLWICRDLLSLHQQSLLLSSIESEGWFIEASHNQAMKFGELPLWAKELADKIHEAVHMRDYSHFIFPSNLLRREPFFDQMIVNVYQPGDLCTC